MIHIDIFVNMYKTQTTSSNNNLKPVNKIFKTELDKKANNYFKAKFYNSSLV